MKKKTSASPIRKIGVLVDTSTTWGRMVCTGIQKYAERHGAWLVFIDPLGVEERVNLPSGWSVDGIIARIGEEPLSHQLKSMRIPVVNVSGIQLPNTPFPRVTTDLSASGRMAAEHFLNRGFRHYAYFSLHGLSYVTTHQHAFEKKLKESGFSCSTYSVRPEHGALLKKNLNLERLGRWLTSLPKPVAVLSWNASPCREILFACQLAGLLVPEEVALLSGCDDDLLCAMAHVPISGTHVTGEQIGYHAAKLLDDLMCNRKIEQTEILIPPAGILTRRSTDSLALSDVSLAKAISFVRTQATRAIKVNDISAYSGLSRRVLERRFETILGRSPAAEIKRVRIERAKELLALTDMPIIDVAEKSGFGSPEYLSFVFRDQIGLTPLKYRRSVRNQ